MLRTIAVGSLSSSLQHNCSPLGQDVRVTLLSSCRCLHGRRSHLFCIYGQAVGRRSCSAVNTEDHQLFAWEYLCVHVMGRCGVQSHATRMLVFLLLHRATASTAGCSMAAVPHNPSLHYARHISFVSYTGSDYRYAPLSIHRTEGAISYRG